ncbi:MAG: DUF5615 family PIN-like protein [Dehalococcoidia bacterium]
MFDIFFDEDSQSHEAAAAARREGFSCLTALEAGRLGLTDEDQLEFAASTGRVLLSRNYVHFMQLHTRWMHESRPHAGIILVVYQQVETRVQTRCLRNIAATYSQEEMRNQLLYLLNWAREDA